MSARPTHDLSIKTGEYTDRQTGEQKARWLRTCLSADRSVRCSATTTARPRSSSIACLSACRTGTAG